MFSILHISDLHRSIREPADNDSLLAALLADRDRYTLETPIVPQPDAIVVSGDLIQGVGIGSANWAKSMAQQYEVAGEFLTALCDRFLGGDKSRMVLIPGNHDVCWNSAYASMRALSDRKDYPADVYQSLMQPGSKFRWDWKNLQLYEIVDQARYESRLDSYWQFLQGFYSNTALPLPIDRSRGFQLFELCDRRIVVAAFESIAGNDCFGYSSSIPTGAVARCALALRDRKHAYDLQIAVWHHSFQGPPLRTDYMHSDQVRQMAGLGFQLGFHGHQHLSETQSQVAHLGERKAMSVVSAGSLCAGASDLPRGVNRQYNVVVIEDDFLHARVHAREMGDGEQFIAKRNGAFSEGFVVTNWEPNTDLSGERIDAQSRNVKQAIALASSVVGDPAKVIEILGPETAFHPFARDLMVKSLVELKRWPDLIAYLAEPTNIDESVTLITALIEDGALDEAIAELGVERGIDHATKGMLRDRIDAKLLMRKK